MMCSGSRAERCARLGRRLTECDVQVAQHRATTGMTLFLA